MSKAGSGQAVPAFIGLELTLHPDDSAAFWRTEPLARLRAGARPRRTAFTLAWHDGADLSLARAGTALVRCGTGPRALWRLERARAEGQAPWPPLLAHVCAEAAAPAALGRDWPPDLAAVASFAGVARHMALPAAAGLSTVRVELGTLRALEAECATCRVVLEGSARDVFALARALAGPLRLAVPMAGLPAPSGARPEAAVVRPGEAVDDALAGLLGHLAQALLYWAPLVAAADPEPVHQMRVALRRLRSAMQLFRRAAASPELDAVQAELRALGGLLGPARDWDVFVAGLGADVAAAFPEEPAVARLLREAGARRRASYAALAEALGDARFRRLGLLLAELVALRPWRAIPVAAAGGAEAPDLRDYARHALGRRLRRVLHQGAALEQQDAEALHALRLQCKKLRYAAEFMAPLFHGRAAAKYVRRIAAVQERLGRLNDGAVAAALLRQLGGGAGRAYATGLVRGYVGTRERRAREKASRAWKRFQGGEPFWE